MTAITTNGRDAATRREAALGSKALERVLSGNLCAGCGACAAAAPGRVSMATSPDGFFRPEQTSALSAAEEARIARVCPGLSTTVAPEGRIDDPLWGPLVSVHSGYATDPALRRNASSGGVLSAVLNTLLDRGAVDHVVQVGADAAPAYGNRTVVSRSKEAVFDAAGSRYAPSAPLSDVDQHVREPGVAAFVGKPCDVAALRALALDDPRIDEKFPYKLSFFCAGVPSLDGARALLAKMGVAEDELEAFRYRGDGWPGYATARTRSGELKRLSYAESWGGVLSKQVQFRCKICPDGTGGAADLVCADAWACDAAGYPIFEEADGVSLVVARTPIGAALLRDAVDSGAVVASRLDVDKIAAMQPGQVGRKTVLLGRLAALYVLARPRPRYRGFHLFAAARRGGFLKNLRNFLGMCRRLVLAKR